MPPKTWSRAHAAPVETPVVGARNQPEARHSSSRSKPSASSASSRGGGSGGDAQALAQLTAFVKREISSNNLLGISDEEIEGAARQVANCSTKREVFDWCSTFMLGESVAAEIVKRREDRGPYFEGQGPRKTAAELSAERVAASAASSGEPVDAGGTKGGRTLQVKPKRGARRTVADLSGAKALVEGQFFECGCFATGHPFRGNCHNCGRIFCLQESLADGCYFCGLDPRRCLAYEIQVQTGRVDEAAQEKNAEGYAAALEKRNQLLKYAKEHTKRTTVIDDQSGVFLESRNAWLSKEERAAAVSEEAAKRRREIATMHKRTGAYTVHLDIVNQNVALGARVDDALRPSSLGQASSSAGGGDTAEVDDGEECCDVVEGKSPSEDDDEEEEETRVVSNPALLQKFWYAADNSTSGTGVVATTAPRLLAAEVPTRSSDGRPEKKPAVRRVISESSRLQNDYFTEDLLHYAEECAEVDFAATSLDAQGAPVAVDDAQPLGVLRRPLLAAVAGAEVRDVESVAPTAGDDLLKHFHEQAEVEKNKGVTASMRSRDDALCLSMHQPWASLLVAGIKTHEGRSWFHEHRGRLWIHAASAKPTDIARVEAHYRAFCPPDTPFPQHYPTSCLLGYVYVTDCMDKAKYEATFPPEQRQEDSPFKFICTGAVALPCPLPMDGKHKIFKLERKVWLSAKQQLQEKV